MTLLDVGRTLTDADPSHGTGNADRPRYAHARPLRNLDPSEACIDRALQAERDFLWRVTLGSREPQRIAPVTEARVAAKVHSCTSEGRLAKADKPLCSGERGGCLIFQLCAGSDAHL